MKSSSPWSLYSQLRGALAFAWLNGVIAAVRNPLWIAAYLTPPLTLLILFNILVAGEMKGYALAGGFVIILATNGLWLTGDAAYYRLYLKWQDMVAAAPVKPATYMFGLALSGLFFATPGMLVFVAVMPMQGLIPSNPLVFALACILIWSSSTSLGFIISNFFRELREVWPVISILTFALTIIPPVYYPITILPDALKLLALAIPTSAGSVLLHEALGLYSLSWSMRLLALIVLVVYSTVLFYWAVKKSRWRQP